MSIFAVSISITFLDSKNKSSSTKVKVPTTLSLAQITEFAGDFGQLMADFSSCRVTGVTPCIGLDLSSATLRAIAASTSDIAEKAWILASTAVGTFTKMKLPTASDSYVIDGTDQVDQTDPDAAALVTIFEDGIVTTGGTIAPVDLRDNDVTGVDEFQEKFRKFTGSN